MPHSSWVIGIAALLAFFTGPALAADRVALVIGNGAYANVSALENPPNDATALAEALARTGFEVTHLGDLDASAMRRALQDFEEVAAAAEIAVVYYAGHGIEVDGENYLIPVDAALKRDTHVEDETVPLSRVERAVGGASLLRLIMLDACRDNPFAAQMQSRSAQRSIGRGLARVEPPGQTLIAYAAKEGTTADDGDGEHSPFAESLLRHIETPGLEINFLFRKVHDEVLQATEGRQEPFVYGSLGSTLIYLVPGELPPEAEQPAASAASGDSLAEADFYAALAENSTAGYRRFLEEHPDSARVTQVNELLAAVTENEIWASVEDEDTVAAYQRYLAGFPEGVYAEDARERMQRLIDERRDLAALQAEQAAAAADDCGHPHGDYRVVGIVPGDVLWVREKPHRHARETGSMPPDAEGIGVGQCVDVSGYRSPWCEVRYQCVSGWSYARYLTEGSSGGGGGNSAAESFRVVGVASNDVLNIRSGPGTQHPIVAEIPPNGGGVAVYSCRQVAGYTNAWCEVSWQGVDGWASSCCLVGEASGRRPD
jgi:uncharacterized caspase-like protein/uncharacterized protein YraI